MSAATRAAMLAVAGGLCLAASAEAGSIWAKGTRRTRSVYTDDTARDVGDILTILINERSRKMEKTSSRDASMGGTLKMGDILPSIAKKVFDFPQLDFSSSADTKFDGGADYDSDRSVTDKITVTVHDVLPNGNLVILGKRQRETAGDKEIVQVSGIVRPSDIRFTNTVASDRVADFRLVSRVHGQERDYTNPGWFMRIFNFLNPF